MKPKRIRESEREKERERDGERDGEGEREGEGERGGSKSYSSGMMMLFSATVIRFFSAFLQAVKQ